MEPGAFQRARDLFARLVDDDPGERLARLHATCDDPVVRGLVEGLLAADAQSRLLRTTAVGVGVLPAPASGVFGTWRLHTQVGTDPYTRTWLATSGDGVAAVQVIERWPALSETQRAHLRLRLSELAAIDHPGLPGPYRLVESSQQAAWVGPPPQGTPVAPDELRGVELPRFVAQIAELVGALHEQGFAHGGLAVASFRRRGERFVVDGYGPRSVLAAAGEATDLADLHALLRRCALLADGRFRAGMEALAAEDDVGSAATLAARLRRIEFGTDTADVPAPTAPGFVAHLRQLNFTGDHAGVLAEVEEARAREGEQPALVDQEVVVALCWLLRMEEAETLSASVLARTRAEGDALGEVQIRSVRSFLASHRGDHQAGLGELDAAYAALHTLEEVPPGVEGALLRTRAGVVGPAGRHRAALRDRRRAADLLLATETRGHRSRGAFLRAQLLLQVGDPLEAEIAVSAAEALFVALPDPAGQADARYLLAKIHLQRGANEAALSAAEGSIEVLERLGRPRFAVSAMITAAIAARRAGLPDRARRWAERAGALSELDWERASIGLQLAIQRLVAGEVDAARSHVERARGTGGPPEAVAGWVALMELACADPHDPAWSQRFRAVAERLRRDAVADEDVVDVLLRLTDAAPAELRPVVLELALDRCTVATVGGAEARCRRRLVALVAEGARPVIDGLVVEETLGRGGMGVVLGARDLESGERVAIKVIEGALLDRATVESEIRAVAALEHPGVVAVRGMGTLSEVAARLAGLPVGAPWFAMERIDGGSLVAEVGRTDAAGLVAVAEQVLRTLAHVHARGLVHLDLKPANLLRDPERGVVLTDFGISRARTGEAGAFAGGTPGYWAPEQVLSGVLGPWTDLYALGCTLWALCSGRPPRKLHGDPLRPLPDTVPPSLARWLSRMIELHPERRFRRATDALAALGRERTPAAPRSSSRPPVTPRLLLLREPPMVGRQRLREELLELARAAAPRIHLVGPWGVGKRRLARWVVEEGREAGWLADPGAPDGFPAWLTIARDGEGLVVGDMTDDELETLARSGLGLGPALTDVLVERAAGRPRFLVAAAELEVRRGNLLPGTRGITRIPDPPDPLPSTPDELAAAWLDLAVGPRRGDRAVQLEEAAARDPIHLDDWQAACVARDAEGDPSFLQGLVGAGLLVPRGLACWSWRARWTVLG
ncbi:MAG: serine/threonine protein kinase [Alphaproteobacteria bacterium]|nr:serine/threonine protein kinase [Alphaproteobacteria bacterium]